MYPDIVDRLLEDAMHHDYLSRQCDCDPNQTVNYLHAKNAREAANLIVKLRDESNVQEAIDALRELTVMAYSFPIELSPEHYAVKNAIAALEKLGEL